MITYKPSSLRLGQFSVLAIDDIAVRPGKCAHQHDYMYTFTLGYEDLELEAQQPLRGSIGDLVTPRYIHRHGAPTADHTSNSDQGTYFLFMNDADRMAPTTYIDTLTMRSLPAEQSESCVRFAYQMTGNVTFKVVVMEANSFDYRGAPAFWTAT